MGCPQQIKESSVNPRLNDPAKSRPQWPISQSSCTSTYSRHLDGSLSTCLKDIDDPQKWVDEALHKFCHPHAQNADSIPLVTTGPVCFGDHGNPYDNDLDIDMGDHSNSSYSLDPKSMTESPSTTYWGSNPMLADLSTESSTCLPNDMPEPIDPNLIPFALNIPIQHISKHQTNIVNRIAAQRHQSQQVSLIDVEGARQDSIELDASPKEASDDSPPESPQATPPKGTLHKKLFGNDGFLGDLSAIAFEDEIVAGLAAANSPLPKTGQNLGETNPTRENFVDSTCFPYSPTSLQTTHLTLKSPVTPGCSSPQSPIIERASYDRQNSVTGSFITSPSATVGRSIFRGLSKSLKRRVSETTSPTIFTPPKTPKKSILAVSLGPKIQARLYLEIEIMICSSANRFLLKQYRDSRLSHSSLNKVRSKNRHQVTDFSFPQELQCELVIENRRTLEFEGICACNPIHLESTIRNWKAIARDMGTRTFCIPDTAIRKHLDEIYWILDMLNVPLDTLREFQNLSSMAQSTMLNSLNATPTPIQRLN